VSIPRGEYLRKIPDALHVRGANRTQASEVAMKDVIDLAEKHSEVAAQITLVGLLEEARKHATAMLVCVAPTRCAPFV